ncbi:hypothetical protein LINPERPRIM_LOCUS15621 [Linum perenne]
MTGLFG